MVQNAPVHSPRHVIMVIPEVKDARFVGMVFGIPKIRVPVPARVRIIPVTNVKTGNVSIFVPIRYTNVISVILERVNIVILHVIGEIRMKNMPVIVVSMGWLNLKAAVAVPVRLAKTGPVSMVVVFKIIIPVRPVVVNVVAVIVITGIVVPQDKNGWVVPVVHRKHHL